MQIVDSTEPSKILNHVRLRLVRRNQNFLACITGPTGSGKTYATLTFMEALGEATGVPFPADASQVVFSSTEFMKLINSGKLKRGSCILYDEAGVGYNNREWQSVGNKMMNYLMQTFRHRNYCVIFNMPDFSFVDVAARKLFHARFETVGIDYTRQIVKLKPFFLSINQGMGKQYAKYYKIKPTKTTLTYGKILRLNCKMPSKELVEAYEAKKDAFTDTLNKEIETELAKLKETKDILKPNYAAVLFGLKRGITITDISKTLEIPPKQISDIKRWLISKGYFNAPVILE